MLLRFVLFFAGIALEVATSNYLQSCKKTKVEENVTLRGGIGAGTFRKLAKVTSMASCIELCCKASSCDVAFLSNMKCYGVECVSDSECESTATDTSDTKVLIAHVRTGKKKENKSALTLAGIPTHNSPPSLKQNMNMKATLKGSKTPGINPLAKGQISGQSPAMGPNIGTTTAAAKSDNHAANMYPGLAGQCKAGKIHSQVTLKGGINAGSYKDVGAVKDVNECADRCCGYAQCDVAFMLRDRCYLVGCADGKKCQLQKAKASPYNPSIVYVSRWNSEGVKHTINVQDDIQANYMCSPMKLMTKVTLKGGLKAGDFTDTGKAGSIGECYDLCCQQPSCNLAFMLGQNCFSVKCFNKDLCSTIPAQPSIFNPQITYVWNRKGITNADKVAAAKTDVPKPAPKCPNTKIQDQVTLVGGLNAGSFHDNGKVKDMTQCRRICCEKPKCNLAFMLGVSCFSVTCKSVALCKTQPAKPSQFSPKISYVRAVGSNDFLSSDVSPGSVTPPVPAAVINTFTTITTTPPPRTTKPAQPVVPSLSSTPPQLALMAGSPAGIPGFPGAGEPESNPLVPPGQPPMSPFSQLGLPQAGSFNPMQTTTLPPLPAQMTDLPQTMPPGLPPPANQPAFEMQPKHPAAPVMPSGLEAMMSGMETPQVPEKKPEATKKTEAPKIPESEPEPVINLTSTITKALPGQAMKMNIVDGKLQLTLDSPANTSQPKDHKTSKKKPGGAFDTIFGGDDNDDKCMRAKVLHDVTLKGGKKSGKFKDHGDVKNMEACKKLCCEDDECNLAFMLEKTCYTVTCKNKDLCDHTPAPPSEYRPRVSYVRPLDDGDKETENLQKIPKVPKNLRCKPSNITNDKTLSGGMGKKNFTIIHDVENMGECMTECCHNKKCDVAYYVDSTCYAVSCTTKSACKPVSGKGKGKVPLISAMLMRPHDEDDATTDLATELEGEDEDKSSESEEVTNLQEQGPKQHCTGSRISSDVMLRGNKAGGNFTSMGKVDNIKMCIALCCTRPRCDIAYIENNKCFAVHCTDGVLCQTKAQPPDLGMNVKLAYMDRNRGPVKERDWMIVYIIVGSLAFAAGLGGIVWAACICTKRNEVMKQRRLLEDEEDEDDEMLPKPTQTRYRTPMHRY